jgi:hypothetical protein
MKDNKNKIILDLCGGTGSWSKPYSEAGYDVRLITLPENDVREWRTNRGSQRIYRAIENNQIYGILAAPPCPQFSFARTNAKKLRDFKEAMSVVMACLDIVWESQYRPINNTAKYTRLKFWALENPYFGFLKNFIGKSAFVFDPYEFGDDYKKRTALWGNFKEPGKTDANRCNKPKFDSLATKEIAAQYYGMLSRTERRAITPAGFAKAFFEANP